MPYIAGLAVVALVSGVLVAVGIFVEPLQGVRSMGIALALCIGVLPRVGMVMGGLSGLDYEVGRSGQVATAQFEETYTNSDRLLMGIVVGAGVSGGAVTALLAYMATGLPDLLLGVLLALLLVLRSRLFDRIRHVLPLRLAGVLGLAATSVATIGQYGFLAPWLPALTLLVGVLLGILRACLRRVRK